MRNPFKDIQIIYDARSSVFRPADTIKGLVAEIFGFFSSVLGKIQTGLVQRYALFFVIGIILVISLYLYLGV